MGIIFSLNSFFFAYDLSVTRGNKGNWTAVHSTFDLAVAKRAYALVWEKPQVYIQGYISFHLVCAYMGVLGKSIRGMGFEEILIESGICASGSIAKVITGKHYNRALRVYKVVFEALEQLLLRRYKAVNGAAWMEEASA